MSEPRVVSDPHVLRGKPVIRGTRISVELILESIAAGESFAQIVDEYPFLTQEDVRAAVTFAIDSLRAETVYPLAPSA